MTSKSASASIHNDTDVAHLIEINERECRRRAVNFSFRTEGAVTKCRGTFRYHFLTFV